jgi:hypothetical protein
MFSIPKIACTAALASLVFLPSCATIISQGTKKVSIESQPSGLDFVVKDLEGNIVGSGKTPQTLSLDTGGGYFKPAKYTVLTKRGGKVIAEHNLTSTVNGWYFGNILIGGLIGMLVVDPLTGAMYTLPKTVDVSSHSTASTGERTLSVASIDTLTTEQRAKLVRL